MQMTKKITLLILSALVAVCIICAAMLTFGFTASADESVDHGEHSGWNKLTSGNNLTLTGSTSGSNYYLDDDLDLSSGDANITISGGNVTLCLNGRTITGCQGAAVITINLGATLTLCDCGGDGKITGGYANYGGGVHVSAGGTFIMEGGTITGNTALYGGGVYVERTADILAGSAYGSFTMTGGSIIGNNASAVSGSGGQGGGIYSDGELSLEGGSVTENNAATSGGGIYCNSGTVVTKNNFILYNNTSGNTTNGSGMYVSDSVTTGSVVFQGGFILDDVTTSSTESLSIQGGYYRSTNVVASIDYSECTVFGKAVGTKYRAVQNLEGENNLLANSSDPYYSTVSETIQNEVDYFVYEIGETTLSTDGKTYDGSAASVSNITVTIKRDGNVDEESSSTIGDNFYTCTTLGGIDSYTPLSESPVNAGVYYVYVNVVSSIDYTNQKYYSETSLYVAYTIEKATLTDITENVTVTYDGEEYGSEYINFDGFVVGETFESLLNSDYATIWYSQTGGAGASDWTESPEFDITVTNCADSPLTIYYCVTFDNYKPESGDAFYGSFTITITPADADNYGLTLPDVSLYYHDTVPELDGGWTWDSTVTVDSQIEYDEEATYSAYHTVSGYDATNYDWQTWASENGITIENNGDDGITLVYKFTVTHSFTESDHTESKEATCTEGGTIEYWYCSTCEKYFSDEEGTIEINGGNLTTDPLGHDYVYNIEEPTESDNGNLEVTCSRCDEVNYDKPLPALGDSSYELDTVEATCTEDGSITYYYEDETYGKIAVATETIEALGHDYVKEVTSQPTEARQGILVVTCSRCDDISDSVTLDNLTDGNYVEVTVKATCEEDGSITYYYVDETYGEVAVAMVTLEKLNHASIVCVDATEATYESAGNIEYYYCTDCERYFTMDDEGILTETTLEEVTIARLTHTTEIILLCVGGAICVALAAILIWQINKKRRAA